MANTQSVCTTFLAEVMQGYHQFGQPTLTSRTSLTSPTNDTFKLALYFSSATLNASTTAYSTTGEVTNTSGTGYTAGGVALTNANTPASANTSTTAGTGYWTPSASASWTSLTVGTVWNCALMYNSTQGNRAVAVYTFSDQTITSGTFTLTMPTNAAGTALLRLATT